MRATLKTTALLSIVVIVIFAIGCSGDSGSTGRSGQAITENDLVNDPTLRVIPEDTLVVFLEHPTHPGQSGDTGEKGVDVIPLHFPISETITFCWEDDDESAGHYAVWLDNQGNEILRVEANGECVTETIGAGYYTMYLYHDGQSEETQPIFMRLVEESSQNSFSEVNAKTEPDPGPLTKNMVMLLRKNKCVGCDLSGANLSYFPISGAYLMEATLIKATLTGAELDGAHLNGAKLNGAKLNGATLTRTDFSNAKLNSADLTGAIDLDGVNGAILTGADLTGATWKNGVWICGENSIGICDITFTNTIGMTFHTIRPGTFTMGSPTSELGRYHDETQHQVTLTQPLYMQTTEVTQGQWEKIMGYNPSYSTGYSAPVDRVSWDDAQAFIKKLNELEKTGKYRLPTEAEWEYACRSGSVLAFANGKILEKDFSSNLDRIGWYFYNTEGIGNQQPVASKDANAWGLYDTHGNVWEWCQDWYKYEYPAGPEIDPSGPLSGSSRVLRGGSFMDTAYRCRSAFRWAGNPTDPKNGGFGFGFRVVKQPS